MELVPFGQLFSRSGENTLLQVMNQSEFAGHRENGLIFHPSVDVDDPNIVCVPSTVLNNKNTLKTRIRSFTKGYLSVASHLQVLSGHGCRLLVRVQISLGDQMLEPHVLTVLQQSNLEFESHQHKDIVFDFKWVPRRRRPLPGRGE